MGSQRPLPGPFGDERDLGRGCRFGCRNTALDQEGRRPSPPGPSVLPVDVLLDKVTQPVYKVAQLLSRVSWSPSN